MEASQVRALIDIHNKLESVLERTTVAAENLRNMGNAVFGELAEDPSRGPLGKPVPTQGDIGRINALINDINQALDRVEQAGKRLMVL